MSRSHHDLCGLEIAEEIAGSGKVAVWLDVENSCMDRSSKAARRPKNPTWLQFTVPMPDKTSATT
jgi:hypothetical protein